MISPGIALLIAAGILAIVLILPFINRRPLTKLTRAKIKSQKVLIEDALKFLYNHNIQHQSCTVATLSEHLDISDKEITKLLEVMRSTGFCHENREKITLTDEGNTDALRIIRVHRVLERYFADETGIEETGWHQKADLVEHKVTAEEVDKIAAKIGNPVFDPHGDPIPSPDGEIQHISGKDLNDLKVGEAGKIIHINDQPETIYAQLVAEGLHPGSDVYVLEKTKTMIRFQANGKELILAPLFAENVSVKLQEVPKEVNYERLTNLKDNEKATIIGISNATRGGQRRRLMDLGVIPGATIAVRMKSMFDDPVAYNIMGATIALRRSETERIFIEKKEGGRNYEL